ncbi:pyruvate dehydrogenase complex dihydrolipoamide acetyltransferase [Algibacter lectus]|uniref:Dihydrolipoamide acetyltransferase component of pyruvate dehydrogenase complex n=1 Tax=Algibacter lectus TaxID=221126 RepID=A0A4R8M528_9FLAO|nr:pyruvate dehydrogenase complex dihydrolipoamide acetyltransferase [Algibacter lectus]MWW26115.1 pyruvate dehydrogenase [Algibacter lectus]TDY60409.1 pyruvate dehydrogenase E2 component (dihydrolipoamide acetyltransferase) [Algibacter lectus]
MAIVVNMPRLSDTMEEGTVAAWLKKVGDKIEEGDILAEIETDKATMEFESFNEGTLLHIGVQEGETTKVDELLAIIGDEGEDISALLSGGDASAEATEEKTEEAAPVVEETKDEAPASAELPEGVIVVTMPRLSDTMEEGTVATWLKKVGDSVEEGDILAEIETDKATMEFESFQSGTLLYVGLQEGDSAKVDELLAIIGPAGTDVSGVASSFSSAVPAAKVDAPKTEAKKEAPKSAPASATPSKPKTSAPAPTPVTADGRVHVSPLAKKLAEDKGINLTKIQGSGENGRIVKRDIENYEPATSAAAAGKFVPSGQEDFDEVDNSQMRKAIAKALTNSKFSAPHYYLSVEFDMENAMSFRTQFNSIPDTKISYNDIVVKACALALKQHPQVNSQWFADKMRLNNHVHIGVAVAVPDGLVVPVVKFANEQSLPQIGAAVRELAGKAKNKKLTPDEMQGSTFTVSNLGMFGIDTFTSIINQPNSAILSVGNIVEKPVVKNGQIVVGHTMKLSLACDHRTVDGATGALFLQTLKGYIENPVTMLV